MTAVLDPSDPRVQKILCSIAPPDDRAPRSRHLDTNQADALRVWRALGRPIMFLLPARQWFEHTPEGKWLPTLNVELVTLRLPLLIQAEADIACAANRIADMKRLERWAQKSNSTTALRELKSLFSVRWPRK